MNYKTQIVDGHKIIYSSDWISKLESLSHWSYYWHQANIVDEKFNPNDKLLEIGIGSGFLINYLKGKGKKIQSLDIDLDKHPDICSDASSFDYSSHDLNGVIAFEVFEHMPLDLLNKILRNLSGCQVPKIVFSVPWNDRTIVDLQLKVPLIPQVSINIQIPRLVIKTPAHFWELSKVTRKSNTKRLITESELSTIFHKNNYMLTKLARVENIQFYCADLDGQ